MKLADAMPSFHPGRHAAHAIRLGVAVLAMSIGLAGCGSVKNLFSSKKDVALKPAALKEFSPSATVVRLWTASAGKGEGRIGARQGPVAANGRV
jgi:outer membrane protein assembly factor BamB